MRKTKRGLWIGIGFLMMGGRSCWCYFADFAYSSLFDGSIVLFYKRVRKTGKLVSTDFVVSKTFRALYG